MVTRAGKAEQAGVMSADQYMQTAGMMANVGGGAADLESIMAKAVAMGMDNAKNIQQMVAATTQLASGSAAIGISTVGGAESALTDTIASLQKGGMNKNMATAVAANSISSFNQNLKSKGNLGDLMLRAEIDSLYNFDPNQMSVVTDVFSDVGFLNDMKGAFGAGGDPDKKAEMRAKMFGRLNDLGMADDFGLDAQGNISQENIAKIMKLLSAFGRKGSGTSHRLEMQDANSQKIVDLLTSGDPNNDNKKVTLQELEANPNKYGVTSEQINTAKTDYAAANQGMKLSSATALAGTKTEEPNNADRKGDEKSIETLIKEQAKYSAKQVEQGASLVKDMQTLVNNISKIVQDPEKMKKDAENAAKNMEVDPSTKAFKEGSDTFNKAVTAFSTALKGAGIDVDKQIKDNVPAHAVTTLKKQVSDFWGGLFDEDE
jgi:hypothetical protein